MATLNTARRFDVIGALVITSGVLAVPMTLMASSSPAMTGIGFLLCMVYVAIGLRAGSILVCSDCGNHVVSPKSRMCPVCGEKFVGGRRRKRR